MEREIMIKSFLSDLDNRYKECIIESMIGEIATTNISLAKDYIKKLKMVAPDDDLESEHIALFLRDKRNDERIKENSFKERQYFEELNNYFKKK